jgi:D-glycero-D-manno-heptose 1,7-bisphosphate phosphatase
MTIETIFFDRDGVINDIVMRKSLVSAPRELSEFHIREDFVSLYQSLPPTINLFVVSNQPDVARQLLPIHVLEQMHKRLQTRFSFKEILYCLHDNADNCHCRKPKPGMINDLLSKHKLTTDTALLIGDSEKDIVAGQTAGIKTVYFKQNHNPRPSCSPDFVIDKLSDMLKIIEES